MKTYQIHYNKSIFNAIDIDEAEQIARGLVEPSMPFEAKIIVVDENEEFIQNIKTITSVFTTCQEADLDEETNARFLETGFPRVLN
jgi:hypothetical protein